VRLFPFLSFFLIFFLFSEAWVELSLLGCLVILLFLCVGVLVRLFFRINKRRVLFFFAKSLSRGTSMELNSLTRNLAN
jgi:hypothetical protein